MKKSIFLAAVISALLLVLSACGQEKDMMEKEDQMHSEDMKSEDSMKDGEMQEDSMGMDDDKMMKNDGDPAPMFSLEDLNGDVVKLSDLKGEKVYVKYWASWCSICLGGLEELNALAGEEQDFRIITIVTPEYKGEQSAEDFKEWFNSQPYDHLTVLLDEDGKWARKFGLMGYPSSYFIGSDGILAKSSPGHVDNKTITSNFKETH
ncbi:TlpA family protein disulfide reductase [Rossellomorea aquimaris]|uniref:TlpA family protein disulfide reductase n=1 Tax=Rossellomorea aquimaris TaxID=189382 RepID=UPI001CD5C5E5|nr:TlpA disulfide reductase family protein [Rossellomorea aquimaris]MCA1054938.1 TlpA family protein disulfide reductase [Rossellomorea aquimaris]